jgi:hypothetical protein
MPPRLMLLPYLQEWDGTTLAFRLLAAPQVSPLEPLAPSEPQFTEASFTFELRLVAGLGSIPTTGSPFDPFDRAVAAPAQATAICEALEATLPIDTTIGPVDPRRAGTQFLKYAPPPYRDASGYSDGRNPYLVTDDRYHCALKTPPPPGTVLKSDPPPLPWGKVLALALRQPLLAEAIGLVRPLTVDPSAGFFDDGGWLYVTLAAGSEGAGLLSLPDGLKSYAARVPPLRSARSLFTSVLFPVAAVPPAASYDELFREVVDYDDGFAKTVYAQQPMRLDPLGEDDDGSRPHADLGVQLGWDDEQVATWLNRQIDPAAATQDAPMGVLGYRVDARESGTPSWHSLVNGTTEITLDGLDLGSFSGELQVEIAPNKLFDDATDTFWIPAYYTTWTGPSLVGPDPVATAVHGVERAPLVEGVEPTLALRYGHSYEFRVRLVDHTRGGPELADGPSNPAPHPHAPLHFRRWVRPGPLRLETALPALPDPANAPDELKLRRPLLAYPACVYAGGSAADVLADIADAAADNRPVGLPDPDVTQVEVELQVAFPGADDGFRTVYTTTRDLPNGNAALDLHLDWQDIADATAIAAPAAGALPVPTARLLRLSVRALCADKADYFGDDDVRRGPVTLVKLRKESADERALLQIAAAEAIEGIFLQPETQVDTAVALAQRSAGHALAAPDNALGRLAAALDLQEDGVGLRARRGHRLLFGCASSLRHAIGPDGASLYFGSVGDLTSVWLIPIRVELERDWSWDGLDYLSIERDGNEVGRVEATRTVSGEAAGAAADRSELVFLDALDPKPAAGQFPAEPHLHYRLVPSFRATPAQEDAPLEFDLHLPITTPPAHVPKLVSAGIALSPYERDGDYSSTAAREKTLWLEFDAPPANPADAFYGRVLAQAPDSVLTRGVPELPETPEPPLPIDPEPIRTIVPGQADDRAGASAMDELLPTDSPRHFLLPLPAGLTADSPELFGFFTYELRVGHKVGWSTAQGRFGRPLRVTGVQHPAPTLTCAVVRNRRGLEVTAPFAEPVLDGESLQPIPPVTQIWVLLYVQVNQADGADMRNVLLAHKPALVRPQRWEHQRRRPRMQRGTATWSNDEIAAMLELLSMGADAPISCLAVETLPADSPLADPVGTGLGYERFLRTSPLVAVPELC